jgi:hypothetical protein
VGGFFLSKLAYLSTNHQGKLGWNFLCGHLSTIHQDKLGLS